MSCFSLIVFKLILFICVVAEDQNRTDDNQGYADTNHSITIPNNDGNNHVGERVDVSVYYECHCPYSQRFFGQRLVPLVQKLGDHINLHIAPYGNVQTVFKDGKLSFDCQHGPAECYGNKLHACAIDQLQNNTAAVIFNACMMDDSRFSTGSDDAAADVCGQLMGVNSESIKQCANSDRGSWQLKQFGDETMALGIHSVPYILINGVKSEQGAVFRNVCKAFTRQHEACSDEIRSRKSSLANKIWSILGKGFVSN